MKTTPFTAIHEQLGAKMHEFAGYMMPIEYSGINDEHLTVRHSVGVFDVSHMGEFWVKGPNALAFLQRITSNDVSTLPIGKAQYSCMPNAKGGIVDDILVYHYENEKYLLVVNAANIEKDWMWCIQNNIVNAVLENASDEMGQLAVQGPKATAVLQELTDIDLSKIPYYAFTTGTLAGIENVIISNTGYTGSGGFELYMYPENAVVIWNAIFEAGKKYDIKPIGLGARDTLRLEKGFCLYGNDIDDTTSPLEAGLGWITKIKDDKNFIGKKDILTLKEKGVRRRLRAFKMLDKGIPRQSYEIEDADGKIIGRVSSGTMSPILKQGIGLGYIHSGSDSIGATIYIKVRKRSLKAEIVKLPFVK